MSEPIQISSLPPQYQAFARHADQQGNNDGSIDSLREAVDAIQECQDAGQSCDAFRQTLNPVLEPYFPIVSLPTIEMGFALEADTNLDELITTDEANPALDNCWEAAEDPFSHGSVLRSEILELFPEPEQRTAFESIMHLFFVDTNDAVLIFQPNVDEALEQEITRRMEAGESYAFLLTFRDALPNYQVDRHTCTDMMDRLMRVRRSPEEWKEIQRHAEDRHPIPAPFASADEAVTALEDSLSAESALEAAGYLASIDPPYSATRSALLRIDELLTPFYVENVEQQITQLDALLEDPNEEVQIAAALSLLRIDDPRALHALPIIERLLTSPDPNVRINILLALFDVPRSTNILFIRLQTTLRHIQFHDRLPLARRLAEIHFHRIHSPRRTPIEHTGLLVNCPDLLPLFMVRPDAIPEPLLEEARARMAVCSTPMEELIGSHVIMDRDALLESDVLRPVNPFNEDMRFLSFLPIDNFIDRTLCTDAMPSLSPNQEILIGRLLAIVAHSSSPRVIGYLEQILDRIHPHYREIRQAIINTIEIMQRRLSSAGTETRPLEEHRESPLRRALSGWRFDPTVPTAGTPGR
jgi:hypothetical protein